MNAHVIAAALIAAGLIACSQMSWLSKTLGLDKLAAAGGTFAKVITAAEAAEADVQTALTDGLAAVTVIETALANPTDFAADDVAVTTAVADVKAALAAFEAVLAALKSI